MKRFYLEFPGTVDSLYAVAEFVMEACEAVSTPLPRELISDLELVVSEAVTNAIRHGVRHEGDLLAVTMEIHDELITLRVDDHGPGFDLNAISEPDLDQPAESGYGIFVIKSLMDEVRYERRQECNRLLMVKRLGRAA